MSVHRIKIFSDSITERVCTPLWDGNIEHTRQDEGVFLRATVKELTFTNTDYTDIKAAAECELITVFLEEDCGGTFAERWRGTFTTYDVKFNENKCLAIVSPKTSDDYDCFFEKWDLDVVVATAGDVVEAQPFAGVYEVGMCCKDCFLVAPVQVCSTPANWCFYETQNLGSGGVICDGFEERYMTCFHRIVGQGTPTTPPPYGSGWTHISGNDWWRCPDAAEIDAGKFDQGRNFSDVLEYLISELDCGLTLRSHFLGINATHAAPPSNIAYTFSDANYQAIQIHQKSDIKRPDATNPAQSFVWKMSLKKLLEDLRTMWQLEWKIDGTDFILEHVTYFDAVTGLDVSQRNIRLEYGKREGGAPSAEYFYWADADATFTATHLGSPIDYGDCGEGRKDYRLNYFSNDVFYIRTVQNQEEIADQGFCLIATELIDGENQIIDGNAVLGWEQIHENLFKFNRFFASGTMNGTADVAFDNPRKTRNLEPFELKVCCDDNFDPSEIINTPVGDAMVQKAVVNYFQGKDANLVKIESSI